MKSIAQKITFGFLVIALLMPGVYVALQPREEVHAQAIVWDIPKYVLEGVIMAVTSAAYVYIKQGLKKLAGDVVRGQFRSLVSGAKGNEPLLRNESWEDFSGRVFKQASGAFTEGFIAGAENAAERGRKRQAAADDIDKKLGNTERLRALKAECSSSTDYDADCATEIVKIEEQRDNPGPVLLGRAGDKVTVECSDADHDISDPEFVLSNTPDKFNNSPTCQAAIAEYTAQKQTPEPSIDTRYAGIEQTYTQNQVNLIRQRPGALGDATSGFITAVCQPRVNISVWLGLGLAGLPGGSEDRKPTCSWQDLGHNWSEMIGSVGNQFDPNKLDFWKAARDMVNPSSSEVGMAFSVSSNLTSYVSAAMKQAENDRKDTPDIKNKTNLIGEIQTSGIQMRDAFKSGLDMTAKEAQTLTGQFIADAVTTLLSTAIGTSLDIINSGILKGGPVEMGGDRGGFSEIASAILYQPDFGDRSVQQRSGERLTRFEGLNLNPGGNINIIAQLTASTNCPSQITSPGSATSDITDESEPNACVLSQSLSSAIEEHLTVGEAMKAFEKTSGNTGLNPNAIFGFRNTVKAGSSSEGGDQPNWQTDLPYRSLVILRKYRVLPVGWEIAAQYIRQFPNACGEGNNCTLKFLLEHYNDADYPVGSGKKNPFYHLIDPSWVLKLPLLQCKLKGFGPIVNRTTPDGQSITTTVRKEICVDEQSCLNDDKNGKCKNNQFGYCIEEKNTWQLEGTECPSEYAGCTEYRNAKTGKTSYLLRNSFQATAICNENNAGCAWFSTKKNYVFAKVCELKSGVEGTVACAENGGCTNAALMTGNCVDKNPKDAQQDDDKPWKSEEANKIYLSGKALESKNTCNQTAEGCRELSDVASTAAADIRIHPAYLDEFCKAGKEVNGTPWYQQAECKRFAIECRASDAGCELYTPTDPTQGVVAASSDGVISCPAQCVGFKQYIEQPSAFGPATLQEKYFTPSSGRNCSFEHVGCTEFTNLDLKERGAEATDYFSKVTQCLPKTSDQDTKTETVFYSTYGSNTNGYRVEKFYLATDDGGNTPKCAAGSECVCTATDVAGQLDKPYDHECREYISAKSKKVSYRYKDDLIYYTADCHTYRQTDNASATPSISKSLSRTCPAAMNKCREFHGPQSGVSKILANDKFQAATSTDGWVGEGNETLKSSNDSAAFNDLSLSVSKAGATAYSIAKTGELLNNAVFERGKGYRVAFDMKSVVAGKVSISLPQFGTPEVTIDGIGANSWTHVVASFDERTTQTYAADQPKIRLRFIPASGALGEVLIDNFWVKEDFDIQYKIDDASLDKLKNDNICTAADTGCSEYTDRSGTTPKPTFRGVSKLCPVEMVGCKEFASVVTPATTSAAAVLGPSQYLINDPKKQCAATDLMCTAYGMPILDSLGKVKEVKKKTMGASVETLHEQWGTVYVKTDPSGSATDPKRCAADAVGCQNFGNNTYMKDPSEKICKYMDVAPDANGNSKAWMRSVCEMNSGPSQISCSTDTDCESYKPTGATGICHQEKCAATPQDNVAAHNDWVFSCPSSANTCRKITDPECVVGKCKNSDKACESDNQCSEGDKCIKPGANIGFLRNDYGRKDGKNLTCQQNYYVMADVAKSTGECNSMVNPQKGCLMFMDNGLDGVCTDSAGTKCYSDIDCANTLDSKCSDDATPCTGDAQCASMSGDKTCAPKRCVREKYNSKSVYAASSSHSVSQKADVFDDITLSAANQTGVKNAGTEYVNANAAYRDANTIYKVKADRQCRAWLACTDFDKVFAGSDRMVCRLRYPCVYAGDNGECSTSPDGFKIGDMEKYKKRIIDNADDLRFMSGLARPDYLFKTLETAAIPTPRVNGGHDSLFQWTESRGQTDMRQWQLNIPVDPGSPYATGHSTPTVKDIDPALRLCRMYARRDAKQCNETKQNVINGYCLEPYPQYAMAFRTGGIIREQSFENYCMTWYPVDQITGQSKYTLANDPNRETNLGPPETKFDEHKATATDYADYQNENLYYCLARKSKSVEMDRREDEKKPPVSQDITITIPKYEVTHAFQKEDVNFKDACNRVNHSVYGTAAITNEPTCFNDDTEDDGRGGRKYKLIDYWNGDAVCKMYFDSILAEASKEGSASYDDRAYLLDPIPGGNPSKAWTVGWSGDAKCRAKWHAIQYHHSAEVATDDKYITYHSIEVGSGWADLWQYYLAIPGWILSAPAYIADYFARGENYAKFTNWSQHSDLQIGSLQTSEVMKNGKGSVSFSPSQQQIIPINYIKTLNISILNGSNVNASTPTDGINWFDHYDLVDGRDNIFAQTEHGSFNATNLNSEIEITDDDRKNINNIKNGWISRYAFEKPVVIEQTNKDWREVYGGAWTSRNFWIGNQRRLTSGEQWNENYVLSADHRGDPWPGDGGRNDNEKTRESFIRQYFIPQMDKDGTPPELRSWDRVPADMFRSIPDGSIPLPCVGFINHFTTSIGGIKIGGIGSNDRTLLRSSYVAVRPKIGNSDGTANDSGEYIIGWDVRYCNGTHWGDNAGKDGAEDILKLNITANYRGPNNCDSVTRKGYPQTNMSCEIPGYANNTPPYSLVYNPETKDTVVYNYCSDVVQVRESKNMVTNGKLAKIPRQIPFADGQALLWNENFTPQEKIVPDTFFPNGNYNPKILATADPATGPVKYPMNKDKDKTDHSIYEVADTCSVKVTPPAEDCMNRTVPGIPDFLDIYKFEDSANITYAQIAADLGKTFKKIYRYWHFHITGAEGGTSLVTGSGYTEKGITWEGAPGASADTPATSGKLIDGTGIAQLYADTTAAGSDASIRPKIKSGTFNGTSGELNRLKLTYDPEEMNTLVAEFWVQIDANHLPLEQVLFGEEGHEEATCETDDDERRVEGDGRKATPTSKPEGHHCEKHITYPGEGGTIVGKKYCATAKDNWGIYSKVCVNIVKDGTGYKEIWDPISTAPPPSPVAPSPPARYRIQPLGVQ